MNISRNSNCIICKGKNPKKNCGRTFCPIQEKSKSMYKVQKSITKDSFFGESPSVFVGKYGWPNVHVGILSPPEEKEEVWKYDAPRHWANENQTIPKIMNYRGSLVNSRFQSNIWAHNGKMLETSQEVGLASKPVDIEVDLKQKPKFHIQYNADILPMGPNAQIEKAQITENPNIHTKVQKVTDDIDLKSAEAMNYLYNSNSNKFDENFLSRILSIGTLGVKKKRTLVPTRWSITAVDDSLGKNILKEIRDYKTTEYQAYFGGYLGNYFLILFLPEIWSYELFESYLPKASWNQSTELSFTTDYENFKGRKGYAYNTAGGYYAARLPILDHLKKQKKQSSVLTMRFITNEYEVPLGVWVVREAVRKTMMEKPLQFGSKELMLKYSRSMIKKKFGVELDILLNKSIILKSLKEQQKLFDFF